MTSAGSGVQGRHCRLGSLCGLSRCPNCQYEFAETPRTVTLLGGWFKRKRPARRPVRLGPRLFVCGDHVENASINGAMASGRRAAEAVLAAGAGASR